MSAFKRINKSDVVVLPYTANKQWEFNPSTLSAANIVVYNGKKYTGSFDPNTDYVTEGQYDRLVFESINHLYYQEFSGSSLDTGSLMRSNNYSGANKNRPSGSYYQYGDVNNMIKLFPTGSGATIKVVSIPKSIYGNSLHPGSFTFSSSAANLIDDGYNNIFDGTTFVGNIFYNHGILVITNPNYQALFPLPPFARSDNFSYLATTSSNYPQYLSPLANDDDRSGVFITGSLYLFGGSSSLFEVNNDGTINLNPTYSNVPGNYTAFYSYSSSYTASVLRPIMQSNTASINLRVLYPFFYYNAATSSIFQKTGCGTGGTGSMVTYNVPYGTFSSSVSQLDANTQASASIAANGQSYANSVGYCTYYNITVSGSFQKNSCGNGGVGSTVIYTVSGGQISSTTSQAAATALASASVAVNGQAYANSNGSCVYYNQTISGSFTRNNCSPYFSGSTVWYTVSASIFSSSVSLNDANASALAYINANGQAYANSNGTCTTSQPVTMSWLAYQAAGVYTDSNLKITKYSPASNLTGSIIVENYTYGSGSFTALVGDRILSEVFVLEPWSLDGTGSLYLDVYGQGESHQITHNSASSLVSDITLADINPVFISGYSSFSSGSDNMISGSFTNSANTINISLVSNVSYTDIVPITGLWNNGLQSGSWYISYLLTSGSSTGGYQTPIDNATSVALAPYQYISKIDRGTPWTGFISGSTAITPNLLKLNNPLA